MKRVTLFFVEKGYMNKTRCLGQADIIDDIGNAIIVEASDGQIFQFDKTSKRESHESVLKDVDYLYYRDAA